MSDILDLKNIPEELPVDDDVPSVATLAGGESLSWTVEHQLTDRERTREYMLLGGAVLLGGVASWWQSSWLTFVVVVMGVIAWELHNRLPTTHRIDIDHKGVTVDGYRHRYEHLHSYDMHTMPDGTARLSVKTTRWHLPQMHIPLGDQDPQQVHALLSNYLLQDEHRIPLVDYFIKK
jgi:hypothetical protein